MSNSQQCPSVEQLKQLAIGMLPDPPAARLEEHLLECDVCAQQTAQLQQADTLLAAMKQAGQAQAERSPDEVAQLERLMTSLSGLRGGQVEATVLSNPPEGQGSGLQISFLAGNPPLTFISRRHSNSHCASFVMPKMKFEDLTPARDHRHQSLAAAVGG